MQRRAVGRDALVAEQVALRDAQAQRLGAGVAVEQARGHAGGELVGVGDAVDAGERVLAEDRDRS